MKPGDAALELQTLEDFYSAAETLARKPVTDADDGYRSKLEKAQKTAQAAGSLKSVLAAKQAIADLDAGRPPVVSNDPEVAGIQKTYMAQRQKADADSEKALAKVDQDYLASLKKLVVELTKAGQIDQAQQVQAKADELTAKLNPKVAAANAVGGQELEIWKKKALEEFPELKDPASPLSKRVQALKELKKPTPSYFKNPQWPYLLAKEASLETKEETLPIPTVRTKTQLGEQLTDTQWLHKYKNGESKFTFAKTGFVEGIENWKGVRWTAVSSDEVVLAGTGGAKMVLHFDKDAKAYTSFDWGEEHTPTTGRIDLSATEESGEATIRKKLTEIVIPKVDFEETTLDEAIDFLRLRCSELDQAESDPAKKGLYFVVSLPPQSVPPRLTLRLKNVPAMVLLKYIADKVHMRVRILESFVELKPNEAADTPELKATMGEAAGAAAKIIIPRTDFQNCRLDQAVTFFNDRIKELAQGKNTPVVILDASAETAAIIREIRVKNASLLALLSYVASSTNHQVISEGDTLRITKQKQDTQKSVFLDDLNETEVKVGHGSLGKHGSNLDGPGSTALVSGIKPEHSLFPHPPAAGSSFVSYALNSKFSVFSGTATVADVASQRSLRFRIKGDGKTLWRSRFIETGKDADEFRVSVEGINKLELEIECPGNANSAWGMWVSPRLLAK